jgi:hypothetical protein
MVDVDEKLREMRSDDADRRYEDDAGCSRDATSRTLLRDCIVACIYIDELGYVVYGAQRSSLMRIAYKMYVDCLSITQRCMKLSSPGGSLSRG